MTVNLRQKIQKMTTVTKDSLRESSKQKIDEAEFLIKHEYLDLAFYVIGYAIEFSLKACVCKNLCIDDLFCENRLSVVKSDLISKFKTHDYGSLIILSGLTQKIREEKAKNALFNKSFGYVIEKANWKPDFRYYPVGTKNKQDVIDFLESAKELIKWTEKLH